MRHSKYLIFLILLLFPFLFAGQNYYKCGGGVPISSCGNYSSCEDGCKVFDWDCSVNLMGLNVCSLGDTILSSSGEIDLLTNPNKVTIVDGSNNGGDKYFLDLGSSSAYDVFPSGDATVELTVNFSFISNTANILQIYYDTNNYFRISFSTASGNDITITHRGDGVTVTKTFDTNLSLDTEYLLIIKISTTLGMAISTDGGSSYLTDGSKTITAMTASGVNPSGGTLGNIVAVSLKGTVDNIKFYSVWRTDI